MSTPAETILAGGPRLRTAVIGVGYLGRFHAEKYAANPAAELVAVADVDPARARAVAAALGVEAVTDYRALAGRIDCASVAVPTQLHHAVACDLLDAGVDVLVEKPLTTTVDEGKALLELAVRRGRSTASSASRASSSVTGSRRSPSAAPTSTSCWTS